MGVANLVKPNPSLGCQLSATQERRVVVAEIDQQRDDLFPFPRGQRQSFIRTRTKQTHDLLH